MPVDATAPRGQACPVSTSFIPRAAACALLSFVLAATAVAAAPAPGEAFRDCPACPEMVVIPPGRFVMGGTPEEQRTYVVPPHFVRMETPRHEVAIPAAFAFGRYSVTFAEWDACVADGGCNGYRPSDEGWGRGRRPVVNVSFDDAQRYVAWIRRRTGQPYRLLSEAEWEYAARAGTTTTFIHGDTLDPSQANYGGTLGRTAEVGSYPPNRFGLHDMAGNSAQWVQDCHHDSYEGAPTDGSAWLTGDCSMRNVRGAAWTLGPRSLRAAQRIGHETGTGNSHLGFRVARDLPK